MKDVMNKKLKIYKYTRTTKCGECIIALNAKTMKYFELNISMFSIWELLEKHQTPLRVIEELIKECGSENKADIEKDVKEICFFLLNNKLWTIK